MRTGCSSALPFTLPRTPGKHQRPGSTPGPACGRVQTSDQFRRGISGGSSTEGGGAGGGAGRVGGSTAGGGGKLAATPGRAGSVSGAVPRTALTGGSSTG